MSDRTTDPEDVIADWFDKATVKRTRQPEPAVTEALRDILAMTTPVAWWDDDKNAAGLRALLRTVHERALAAVPAPSPAPMTQRDDLCPDCGHHLHRPNPGQCQWRDCRCGVGPAPLHTHESVSGDLYHCDVDHSPAPARAASPSPAPAAEPSTETGQQLLAHHGDGTWFTLGRDDLRRAILIIEAEAGILGWNRRAASDREIAEASEQEGEGW